MSVGIVITVPDPFYLELARGNVSNVSAINKFGRNPDIDQIGSVTTVKIGRDIWDLGIAGATMWLPPTTARTHQIASSNDEDGGAGGDTGALTLRIFGLDANYVFQQEDVTLNGTTNVATASTYTMIHRMYVLTAGSTGRNLGNIDATADSDTTVTARITIDNNQTAMAIFQIPGNKTGYMLNAYASLHKAGGATTFADAALMIMEFGATWRLQDSFPAATEGSPRIQHDWAVPFVVPAKAYIKIVGNPSKDAQDMSGGFDVVLMDN